MARILDVLFKKAWELIPHEFHDYLHLPGKYKRKCNTEFTTLNHSTLRMDELHENDANELIQVESESTAIYEKDFWRFSKYESYSRLKNNTSVVTAIIYTGNPNHGLKQYDISSTLNIHPIFISFKEMDGDEKIRNIKEKIQNNIQLTQDDALDLVFIPLMKYKNQPKDMIFKSYKLLKDEKSINTEFKQKLLELCKEIGFYYLHKDAEKLKELYEVIGMKFDPLKYDEYEEYHEKSLKIAHEEGIEQGIEKGIKEGIKEGKKQTLNEVASQLKGKLPYTSISQITGLSIADIEKL